MGIPDMVTVAVFMESRKKAKKKNPKKQKTGESDLKHLEYCRKMKPSLKGNH